jgi:hypothetical protein
MHESFGFGTALSGRRWEGGSPPGSPNFAPIASSVCTPFPAYHSYSPENFIRETRNLFHVPRAAHCAVDSSFVKRATLSAKLTLDRRHLVLLVKAHLRSSVTYPRRLLCTCLPTAALDDSIGPPPLHLSSCIPHVLFLPLGVANNKCWPIPHPALAGQASPAPAVHMSEASGARGVQLPSTLSVSSAANVGGSDTQPLRPDRDAVCTICCEVPELADCCVIPSCGHAFCVNCVLSWATVRCVCPNCKTPFDMLRVRRDASTGAPLPGGRERDEDVHVLRTADWVTVQDLEPIVEDIAAAFHVARLSLEESRREVERAGLLTGVRTFACEEAEDVFEAMFWEQENMRYDCYVGDAYDDGGFASPQEPRRRFGNRRHGANGYMASGHMVATPAVVAGSSSTGGASSSSTPLNRKEASAAQAGLMAAEQQHKPSSSGGKRKKKIKKKSRAAALAAAEACRPERLDYKAEDEPRGIEAGNSSASEFAT